MPRDSWYIFHRLSDLGCCSNHHLECKGEWQETAGDSGDSAYRTRIFPVVEPEPISARTFSPEQNKRKNKQADDGGQFDTSENKSRFTVESYWKDVEDGQ
ncbi:hypothetical protein N7449_009247 [Penicillium cf. viridicatum]|uniref:Uncharacterized protein n=1 Tax=Penicillium cf. viridicatum TaxID=2972119 RepID=A0A9W9M8E3_9EURO|nr:hypothetical protein N7449_009247 [Penicillium cf. viridicatum]